MFFFVEDDVREKQAHEPAFLDVLLCYDVSVYGENAVVQTQVVGSHGGAYIVSFESTE